MTTSLPLRPLYTRCTGYSMATIFNKQERNEHFSILQCYHGIHELRLEEEGKKKTQKKTENNPIRLLNRSRT